jgi:hypothetical protein
MINPTKQMRISKLIIFINVLIVNCSLLIVNCTAGPPFNTDDPQPVDYKHWEFYISSINTFNQGISKGTLPHFEVNYGVVPNVQLHMIAPLNYNFIREYNIQHSFNYGYGYTELGIKYRFVKENENTPQLGTFPIIEVPTVKNNEFSNGKTQIYIPVWLQKSWGKLTTYGGTGYWVNPGTGNKNWLFAGLEIQYDFSKLITFGGELIYHTPSMINTESTTIHDSFGINIGGFINFSEKFHFIFSSGRYFTGQTSSLAYAGVLWTI